ncbi:MAG: hypothetical protein SNJ57_20635 [Cyanobacteriota bacterium]
MTSAGVLGSSVQWSERDERAIAAIIADMITNMIAAMITNMIAAMYDIVRVYEPVSEILYANFVCEFIAVSIPSLIPIGGLRRETSVI